MLGCWDCEGSSITTESAPIFLNTGPVFALEQELGLTWIVWGLGLENSMGAQYLAGSIPWWTRNLPQMWNNTTSAFQPHGVTTRPQTSFPLSAVKKEASVFRLGEMWWTKGRKDLSCIRKLGLEFQDLFKIQISLTLIESGGRRRFRRLWLSLQHTESPLLWLPSEAKVKTNDTIPHTSEKGGTLHKIESWLTFWFFLLSLASKGTLN